MPELTKQQQSAVEDRGGALLVSAAAGSGKTKVLVERLFRYVTVEGRNIDDFLIITYTRAAAAELRGKSPLSCPSVWPPTPETPTSAGSSCGSTGPISKPWTPSV